jgi:hypothetical protein
MSIMYYINETPCSSGSDLARSPTSSLLLHDSISHGHVVVSRKHSLCKVALSPPRTRHLTRRKRIHGDRDECWKSVRR